MQSKVKVKQGTVIGGEGVLPNGKRYHYFKGIPYAVPPLGKLRFKAPVPLEKFRSEEIHCVKEGNVPCQFDRLTGKMIGSEDCLFLNVYSPQTGTNDDPMPVMVYIYGGAYINGSGNSELHNPLYLMQEGVVVVTFNYRLGIFGFISLAEANIPGNAGIKDQRLVLQWIQENISQFNGNPNNVTLFGESAGASSTHFHVLSKGSNKLFHKAIMQSGMVTMLWACDRNPSEKTKKLAKSLGCSSEDPFEIIDFLQTFSDLHEFVKPFIPELTMDDYLYGHVAPSKPVIEKDSPEAVLTQASVESLKDENSISIPMMIGYNSAEGILMLPCVIENLKYYDKHLDLFIPKDILPHLNDQTKAEVADKMRDFYFYGQQLSESNLQNLSNLFTDYFFALAANELAEIHFKKQHNSPLFFYRFDVDESLNLYKRKVKIGKLRGASHVDDVFYIFQLASCPEPWDKDAKDIVLKMCKLWTNFAKNGNPTPNENEEIIDCTWEPVNNSDDKKDCSLNALKIDKKLRMIGTPDAGRIEFWRKIKQQYVDV